MGFLHNRLCGHDIGTEEEDMAEGDAPCPFLNGAKKFVRIDADAIVCSDDFDFYMRESSP
jgi:hypothetical protein